MERILTAAQMKAMDRHTISEIGVPSCVLMERASLAVAEAVQQLASGRGWKPENTRILAVCGPGNNGGDGLAAARILFLNGWHTSCFMTGSPDRMTEETARQEAVVRKLGIPVVRDAEDMLPPCDIVIDAVFGTGLSRNAEGAAARLIRSVNTCGAAVVSVDIPSGIHADTGCVMGEAVRADVTVTMQHRKPGLLLYPGARYAGKVICAGIGVTGYGMTEEDGPLIHALSQDDLSSVLPGRAPDGNKGTFGKVLLAAGSEDMAGAAILAASAALRSGAGMVRLVTVPENREAALRAHPELMISTFRTEEEALAILKKELEWCDVCAAGPGMGNTERTEGIIRYLLSECRKPLILDADALNALKGRTELLAAARAPVAVTPHIGEMSRLTGRSIPEIKADLIRAASDLAASCGITCHLKDARSVTALPGGGVWITCSGNSGMASAGSGDVLTGIMAAVTAGSCSSGKDRPDVPPEAAAAFLHGLAGDMARKRYGERSMTAGDMIAVLKDVLPG